MKITARQLKHIIREERSRHIREMTEFGPTLEDMDEIEASVTQLLEVVVDHLGEDYVMELEEAIDPVMRRWASLAEPSGLSGDSPSSF